MSRHNRRDKLAQENRRREAAILPRSNSIPLEDDLVRNDGESYFIGCGRLYTCKR